VGLSATAGLSSCFVSVSENKYDDDALHAFSGADMFANSIKSAKQHTGS